MSMLVDTNILTRLVDPNDPSHRVALNAVNQLTGQGELLHIVPQIMYEYWVVCTRPPSQNGLGFTPAQAHQELTRLRALFTLLDDNPAILPQWERLVIQHQVSGKNAHDARLVAVVRRGSRKRLGPAKAFMTSQAKLRRPGH